MSFIPNPGSLAEAMAHALGAALATAVLTALFVAILSLLKLPKLLVVAAGTALLPVLQAGSLTQRAVRGGTVVVAALLIALALNHLRSDALNKRVFVLVRFVVLPLGIALVAVMAVLLGNGISGGAFPSWSGICGVGTALAVASIMVYVPGQRWGRIVIGAGAILLAAFANSVVDLYRPAQTATPPRVMVTPDAVPPGPFTITSQGNVLSVALPPGVPLPSRQDTVVLGAYGRVPMTTYVTEEPSGDTYIAVVSTLPQEAFERSTASQILDGWRDNSLRGMVARATSQEELKLADHEGRRMYFESSDARSPIYGRMDCFIARPHLCQVGFVGGRREAVSRPAVSDFFASTRLEGVAIYTR